MEPNIDRILDQMTLEEKAALCTGAGPWTTTPIPRLGVPAIFVADGPHGVRKVPDETVSSKSLPATCFPTASSLASTWDPALLREMGQALAEECVALGVDVLLGPGVNMKRSPLGGRNFEYFSEDPYLAGELAAALIDGVQSRGVGTSLKHFAANNQEYQRFSINAEVDERTLREIYYPAFETAVKRAQPWTVMCAYNKLNGEYCSEHHGLLVDLLKNEWGFKGFVVSDWGAVHDRPASLRGGLDLEMPGPQAGRVQAVVDAVRSGALDEAALNESVRRILRIVQKSQEVAKGGDAAGNPAAGSSSAAAGFNVDGHHRLAQRIAAEGMVLLKNDGILPLQGANQIAVIGRAAEAPHFQGGGSSHINPTRVTNPVEALRALAGGAELAYAEGYPAGSELRPDLIEAAVQVAQTADVALLYIALPAFKESEGYDRPDMDLTEQQVALIQAVARVQPRTVVVLNNGAPVAVDAWIDGVAAVLEGWMMGQAGAGAVADILFGRVNPSGRLAETFPERLEDTPAYLNWPGEAGQVRYGEGLYIGYRYYDARRILTRFPFGFGLSYTTFAYGQPRVSAQTFRDVDGVTLSVDITNTGPVAGKEVVQVYVRDLQSGLPRPVKELKGFAKVALEPGETKTVTIPLDFRAFAYYHPRYGRWITEDGAFDLLVGASAEDIRGVVTLTLESTLALPSVLDEESTIREWLADPRGKVVFAPMHKQMMQQMTQTLGGGEAGDGIGMDMMGFLMEMPLRSVLGFQTASLPAAPEAIVADMLNKVRAMP
jgi:beta-glucosidase